MRASSYLYAADCYTAAVLVSSSIGGSRMFSVWFWSLWFLSFLLFFFYPGVCESVFSFFACNDVDGIVYLEEDYRVECSLRGAWSVVLFLVTAPVLPLDDSCRSTPCIHAASRATSASSAIAQ